MNKFTVFKASAGSGKTTQLVTEYLTLAFQKSDRFRNILAITFTNNATAEMKERIVQTLYTFAFKNYNNFNFAEKKTYDTIQTALQLDNKQMQENAEKILQNILYDYDNFSISTIDSFFQRIVRAFALEFGLNLNFNLEISLDEVFEKTINLLISRISKEEESLTYKVEKLVQTEMDTSGKWKINNVLTKTLTTIYEEETAMAFDILQQDLDSQKLKRLSENYKTERETLTNNINTELDSITKLIKENNWEIKKRTNIENRLYSSNTFDNFLGIFPIKTLSIISDEQKDILNSHYCIIKTNQNKLTNLNFIFKNIDKISIMLDLKEISEQIQERDNLFYLSETNNLISRQIEEDDTPYIYEKIGNKYAYFFIDEFQDTSKLQWNNFIPILQNALAGETITGAVGEVKLFGDIKQAIYRFRNGDSTLLHQLSTAEGYIEQIKADPSFHNVNNSLDTNYRSSRSIINFNNNFFKHLTEALDPDGNAKCKEFYADVKQKIGPNAEEGFVSILFKDSENKDDNSTFFCKEAEKIIDNLLKNGVPLRDISILCSANDTISIIGQHLASNGYAVLSERSLLLSQSDKIQTLIAAIKYIDNYKDTIQKFIIAQQLFKNKNKDLSLLHKQLIEKESKFNTNFSDYIQEELGIEINFKTLQKLPLFSKINCLIKAFNFDKETDIFLITFLDNIDKYLQTNNAFDIGKFKEWWEKKGATITLPSPEGLDAVTITTIHKSKGLAYPYVIFPFSEWGNSRTKETKWIYNNEYTQNPDNTLPIFLAKLKSGEVPAQYIHHYDEETKLSLIDKLNKIYVAQTRPRKGLFIITTKRDRGNYAKHLDNFIRISNPEIDSNQIYFYNEQFVTREPNLGQQSSETQEPKNDLTCSYHSDFIPNKSHLLFDKLTESEAIKKGNAIHSFLSSMMLFPQTEEEIFALTKTLSNPYKDIIINTLKKLIENKNLQPYFCNTAHSFNEISILTPQGEHYRPDRVVFLESGEVAVIDYKTGGHQEKYQEKYKEQVSNYCFILKEMGYEQVTGHLIYLEPFEYEKVI